MAHVERRVPGMPTILLVEDEPDIRESVLDVLQAGLPRARILAAASAEEGLGFLGSHHVDAVLSDYRLPGLDGLRLLTEALRLAPEAPRFLMTGFTQLEVPVEALNAARLEAVLSKPLGAVDLVTRLRSALARAGHA